MTFPILPSNGASEAFSIDNSVRLDKGSSPYLYRTNSSAGNRRTFTISLWVKISEQDNHFGFMERFQDGSNFNVFGIRSTGKPFFYQVTGGTDYGFQSSRILRDYSAWYHLVYKIDTTQSTASDRQTLYINGVEDTAFADQYGTPPQNYDFLINSNNQNNLLRYSDNGPLYIDGYVAEYHFVDGTALDADSFGEFNDDGVWTPIAYDGSYGTNGFHLDFADSSNFGKDVSSNATDFTSSGLASTDQTTDTCTNNFATWNVNNVNPGATNTFSEGALQCTSGGAMATFAMPSGKWYWEVRCNSSDADQAIGAYSVTESGTSLSGGTNPSNGFIYQANGNARRNGTVEETWSTFTSGDIISFRYDVSTRVLSAYKNNTLAGDITLTDSGDLYAPHVMPLGGNFIANFGQDGTFAGNETAQGNSDGNGNGNFYYSVPSGHLALCSKSLLTAGIDDSASYMNTVTYTGTGADGNAITGVGFKPDWLWIKRRNASGTHVLTDSTRGVSKQLFSNLTNTEQTNTEFVASFDSDGFTLNDNQTGTGDVNYSSSGTYVGWSWLANGGTTSSNSDGSITSTVQANTTAGFSIVTYTGTGANATVGHGLNSAPNLVIIKNRDRSESWRVGMTVLGFDKQLLLSGSDAVSTDSAVFNSTAPTSSVFSIGTRNAVNASGEDLVAYCFHNVEGFSKFGTFKANSSSDGSYVYLGFQPELIIVKNIESLGADQAYGAWLMNDDARSPRNNISLGDILTANNAYAEGTRGGNTSGSGIAGYDLYSNGFKGYSTSYEVNQSTSDYVYWAWAKHPFSSSAGVPGTAR